jgi:hypothetical protein
VKIIRIRQQAFVGFKVKSKAMKRNSSNALLFTLSTMPLAIAARSGGVGRRGRSAAAAVLAAGAHIDRLARTQRLAQAGQQQQAEAQMKKDGSHKNKKVNGL